MSENGEVASPLREFCPDEDERTVSKQRSRVNGRVRSVGKFLREQIATLRLVDSEAAPEPQPSEAAQAE